MKKYEYVEIRVGKFIGVKCEAHRQIIDEYASKGYRYVGYIPTKMSDHGKYITIDLIFEKETQL